MDDQRPNRAGIYVILLAIAFTAGCSREQPISTVQKAPRVPGTGFFDRFNKIENFNVTVRSGDMEVKCRLDEGLLGKFKIAFEDAIPDPAPLTYEVIGDFKFHADGKDYEASLLWISNDEAGVRLSAGNYWKGINKKVVYEVVRECVKKNIGGLSK